MSIGRVSAGNGYEYLTGAVFNDAHDYYTGAGEAPGRWAGGGIDRLGLSGRVEESEMALLFGAAAHPHTGEVLSRPYQQYRSVEERIADAVEALGADPAPEDVARIRAEQYRIGERVAVAGYDCTFSPAKSVSSLWALAPDVERRQIEAAHDAAIDAAFAWLEERALHTRAGAGGIRHLDAEGFIVARFQHRTSRNGDPQLHTHCAVANRVWAPSEERWFALDGQGLYRERAGTDAVYMAAIEHELTERLGVGFETRGEVREIATVPAELTLRWSSRRRQILDRYSQVADDLGRAQTPAERSDVLRTATLATRQDKTRNGHVGLHDRWQHEAAALGVTWSILTNDSDIEQTAVLDPELVIGEALDRLEAARARWTYSHLTAALAVAAGRALTADELDDLATAALRSGRVVELSVADVGNEAPARRRDGHSVYDDPHREQFSTIAITDAEAFLIETANEPTAPTTSRAAVKAALASSDLGVDQAAAVEAALAGPERIAVVIGPAGSGKTHAQRAVVDIARRHDRDVFGLALSQNAADVLAEATGTRCENIARTRFHSYPFPRGGIVIVDEAAMAGTLDLAWVVRTAIAADCKVVLVGDDRQLQSPSAGGIVRTLAANASTVWLAEIRRFSTPWERDATMTLRDGDPGVAAVYDDHDRLQGGSRDEMTARIVADWWDDHTAGRRSLMMAADNDTVADLAGAARALRIAAGEVEADGVELRDGNRAGVGDLIVTRRNTPYVTTDRGRKVTNRAVWHVTQRHPNGALTVVSDRHRDHVLLPADYVAGHVELGYAATSHGAQGRTVDVGRAVYDERTSHSGLYVMMSRGQHLNVGYGVLEEVSITDQRRIARTAAGLFAQIIGNDDPDRSALDTLAAELAYADSTTCLDALRDDWTAVIANHLRDRNPLEVGDLVNAADRDNIGTITAVEGDTATVHFVSPEGYEADVPLPVELLTVIRPATPGWTSDIDQAHAVAAASNDAALVQMVDYLATIEQARTTKAEQLAAEAAKEPWTRLVPDHTVARVAYYRDRYQVTDTDQPLGLEPPPEHRRHHEQWQRLRAAVGPAGTLHHLARLRDSSNITAEEVELVSDAMRRRRDHLISQIGTAERPPAWATRLVGTEWSPYPDLHRRQRDLIGRAAVYRDRYNIADATWIGQRPHDQAQVRVWNALANDARNLQEQPEHVARARDRDDDRER